MCQKCHAQGNIKIQGIDCGKLPHTEVFKLKHLLFTAEIFLNAPSGKVSQGDIYHVFFGFDFFIGCKHHGMFRNAVNQYEINIFLRSGNLHFHMRKIGIVRSALVCQDSFDRTLSLITKLCGRNLFPVKEEFSFGSKTDDIVLFQFIKFQKHLVVIVASVHGKGCFAKESCTTFHCRKSNIIYRGKMFFF